MTHTITLKTFAKLNLSLYVFPPREDGYHPLHSVFQTISLYDTLHIEPISEKTCILTSNHPAVPTDHTNILFGIYEALKDKLPYGFRIHIDKHIPMGGGLGGGSTNAGGFLYYLNKEFLNDSLDKLIAFATPFGADIPFFLVGGTALVTGIGEHITPIQTQPRHYLLITPPIHCNTGEIFKAFDTTLSTQQSTPPKDTELQTEHLGENTLKPIVFNSYPEFQKIEAWAHKEKVKLYMSGTGATTFIPFHTNEDCEAHAKRAKTSFPDATITVTKALDHASTIILS